MISAVSGSLPPPVGSILIDSSALRCSLATWEIIGMKRLMVKQGRRLATRFALT